MAQRSRRRHLPGLSAYFAGQGQGSPNVWDEGESNWQDAGQDYEDQ